VKQPCIDCGTPITGTRCTPCQAKFDAKRGAWRRAKNKQYDAAYRRQAKIVRANARICWICGQGRRDNDPWQADHIIPLADGGVRSPLAAAHRSCNIARSNRRMAPKRV